MVEAYNSQEEEEDWGDEWDEAGNENEFDLEQMQESVAAELVNEKAIAENMRLIEEMQRNREVLMSSKVGRLTQWKLVDVIEFVEILRKEYGKDLSKIEDQTCALCCCELYEGVQ